MLGMFFLCCLFFLQLLPFFILLLFSNFCRFSHIFFTSFMSVFTSHCHNFWHFVPSTLSGVASLLSVFSVSPLLVHFFLLTLSCNVVYFSPWNSGLFLPVCCLTTFHSLSFLHLCKFLFCCLCLLLAFLPSLLSLFNCLVTLFSLGVVCHSCLM
jgi:hypothetical protein